MKKIDNNIILLAFAVAIGGPCFIWMAYEQTQDTEYHEFSTWALGSDYQSIDRRDIPARWNERHGDLFTLHIDDDVTEGNKRMYEAWRKHKLK